MHRVSDDLADEVRLAIEGLEALSAARDSIQWEVFPFMGVTPGSRAPGVHYMIGVGVRVELTGDHVLKYDPVSDPYDRQEVSRVVRDLHRAAEQEAAVVTAAAMRDSNGHGSPGGGLIIP